MSLLLSGEHEKSVGLATMAKKKITAYPPAA